VRQLAAALLALAGCSIIEVRSPATTQQRADCKWGHVAADTVGGAGSLVAGTVLLATAEPGNDWLGLPNDMLQKGAGLSLLAAGSVYAASALYGTGMAKQCEQLNDTFEQERIAHEVMLARRERAWALTREAAAAARTADCNKVVELNAQVRAVDGDFHASVFVRDAAIARCLALVPGYSIK
jgi:hypothetical protein